MNINIDTPEDVTESLAKNDVALDAIDGIIMSHWHFDNVGDPSLFPVSTSLVVGPGFRQALFPGFPVNPESMLAQDAFAGRTFMEADFSNTNLRIADLEAVDWFGDSSFYLLNTPGHAVGHMSTLARTKANSVASDSTFVLLAGDVCHHAGELRPSHLQSLPSEMPAESDHRYKTRSEYTSIHPHQCLNRLLYCPSAGCFNLDAETMRQTVEKVAALDADIDVFVVLAHDHWLLDVVDLFPRSANDWKAQGWKEKSTWRFLLDFE